MHWRNSDFQYAYFIAGHCHTADEAYRKLSECLEDRERARDEVDAKRPLQEARRIQANSRLKAKTEILRLEGQAELNQLEVELKYLKPNYEQCLREIESLKKMLQELDKYRKYKDKSPEESYQLIQREEWKLELIQRAKEFLLMQGTIPPDHLRTMLNHPDFKKEIAPIITKMLEQSANTELSLLDLIPADQAKFKELFQDKSMLEVLEPTEDYGKTQAL